MKVMVINDYDGHCTVIKYTLENMKKCLQYLIKIRWSFEDEATAQNLLDDNQTTAEQIEEFFHNYNAPIDRSGGGNLHIVDVKDDWIFQYGPWE